MSRDWTPREMFFADLQTQKECGKPIRGSLFTSYIVKPNGEKVPYMSKEEVKVLKMFKELGFLFSDNLYSLWKATEKHPRKRKQILMETELELEKIIEADKNNKNFDTFDSTLVNWYLGKLDPNYYYGDRNGTFLEKHLYEKIMGTK